MATFGNTDATNDTTIGCEDIIRGGLFTMGAIDGTGNSITVIITNSTDAKKMKCLVYEEGLGFLTNGITEEKTIPATGIQTVTFDYLTGPSFTADAKYYLMLWSEAAGGIAAIRTNTSVGDKVDRDTHVYNAYPDPLVLAVAVADDIACIYCTYTEVAVVKKIRKGVVPRKIGLPTARNIGLGM